MAGSPLILMAGTGPSGWASEVPRAWPRSNLMMAWRGRGFRGWARGGPEGWAASAFDGRSRSRGLGQGGGASWLGHHQLWGRGQVPAAGPGGFLRAWPPSNLMAGGKGDVPGAGTGEVPRAGQPVNSTAGVDPVGQEDDNVFFCGHCGQDVLASRKNLRTVLGLAPGTSSPPCDSGLETFGPAPGTFPP